VHYITKKLGEIEQQLLKGVVGFSSANNELVQLRERFPNFSEKNDKKIGARQRCPQD